MQQNSPQHIAWVDLLRIVACFLVVLAHCCDPYVASFDTDKTAFYSGAAFGSMVRCCVPLFVMISGVLLLPVKMDMQTFYAKRLKRILIPLVIWSLVLPLAYFAYFKSGIATSNPGIDMATFTGEATLRKLYTFVFNFTYDTTPLWYLYMLVGIYLFLPIIGAWLKQAQQKEIKIFLWIWGISMCIPMVQMFAPLLGYQGNFGSMGILGDCLWNPYGTFYYFSGFLGYVVLAHYLVRYPLDWSWGKTLGISLVLFAVGYAITFGGFLKIQELFPGDYTVLEIIWYFSGINVFMMTFAVFIIFRKIQMAPSPIMAKIAALTFGVFLCHFVVVQACYDFVYAKLPIAPYLQIPVIAVLTFIVSLGICWVLSLNKWTRKSIM